MSVPEHDLRELIEVLAQQTDCLQRLQQGMAAQRQAFVKLGASPVQDCIQRLEGDGQTLNALDQRRERCLERIQAKLPSGTRPRVSALLPHLNQSQARRLKLAADDADRAARKLRGETRAAERLLRLSQQVNEGVLCALSGQGSELRSYDHKAKGRQDGGAGGRLVHGTA